MRLLAVSDRCSGCRACQLNCAMSNSQVSNPRYGAINIVAHFPDPGHFEVKVCTRCGSCMEACPVGAISRMDNGFFRVDRSLCMGCGTCVDACPQKVVRLIPSLNVAFTCVGCGECVRYCPKEAIVDGDGEVQRA